MSSAELDELERLAKAATPGPWYPAKNHTAYDGYGDSVCTTEQTHNLDNNLTYIVAACNAAPSLIAENRALQEKVRELERQKRVLVEKMAIDILCSECPVSEACPYKNATFIDLEDCAKQLEKWSENAAKEAGELR